MNPIFIALLIPFLGTALGSAFVFFMKKEINPLLQKVLLGFASGVMVAASVWSLLIPGMEMGGVWQVTAGLLGGFAMLLIIDQVTPHLHLVGGPEGPKSKLSRTAMLSLAVTIHNFPEGMAVGVAIAGALSGGAGISTAGALVILLAAMVTPLMPSLLALAAGAMLYVVVEELVPEASQGEHSNFATVGFAIGFALMMVLDVVLG